jgi:KDO2-lipid IV(A) lauroyltransferase
VTAHYGNWEYLSLINRIAPYQVIGVYKKLKNPHFDRLIRRSREKFGITTIPIEKIARKLISMKHEKEPSLSVFLADQRPIWQHIQYWTKFMGIDTPLYLGTEKLARKLGAAVVFLKIRKVRRGIYETEFELITEEPRELPPYQVTEAHVRILEGMIREAPQFWLWSHRRWKHSLDQYKKEHGDKAARRVSSHLIG